MVERFKRGQYSLRPDYDIGGRTAELAHPVAPNSWDTASSAVSVVTPRIWAAASRGTILLVVAADARLRRSNSPERQPPASPSGARCRSRYPGYRSGRRWTSNFLEVHKADVREPALHGGSGAVTDADGDIRCATTAWKM